MLDTTASARSPGPNHCSYLMQGQIQKKTRGLESILGGPQALHFTELRRKELGNPDKKVFPSGTTESIFVPYSVGVFRGAVILLQLLSLTWVEHYTLFFESNETFSLTKTANNMHAWKYTNNPGFKNYFDRIINSINNFIIDF